MIGMLFFYPLYQKRVKERVLRSCGSEVTGGRQRGGQLLRNERDGQLLRNERDGRRSDSQTSDSIHRLA